MADVTEAPTQDAIAESLLGEPQEQQVAEQPVAEQPEVQETTQEQPEQQIEQQPEEVENWLPTEQDKIFPDEVLSRYCQRYGLDENMLANPQLKQLVIDKINSDIYLQQQQQEQQFAEPEPVQEPTPEPAQPQLTREQYFANLDQLVAQRTDPQVAKDFHTGFLRSFGVPEAEIAKVPPQQAMQFTQHMTKYALNMMTTFIPDLLQAQLAPQLSQAFPGFGEMYERSAYAMAWDRVRNSDPTYSDLPAYGTKQFSQSLRAAAAKIPGFEEMQFTDGQGKPLPPMENSMRKYGMLAQAIKGQVNPQLLQQAAGALNRNQRRAEVRRSAGNLGSGQSRNAQPAQASSQFQTNQDIFDDDTLERLHGRL